ncbi:hypothetical protein MMYC01_210682, partial [Madurella mycetomatis]
MAPPYNARTLKDLPRVAKEHGLGHITVILDLPEPDLRLPTSRWNIQHLFAYRLLVLPESEFLPIFVADHLDSCSVCYDKHTLSQKWLVDTDQVESLIGNTPHRLCEQAEHDLLRLPHGSLWSALAQAVRDESTPKKEYPQRERTPRQLDGYVNSAIAIPGSSPSDSGSSPSSSFSDDTVELYDDEHEARSCKPEDVTVHLAICFLQVALNLCLLQDRARTQGATEIKPRIERSRLTVQIAGVPITSEDDGGICRMHKWKTPGNWSMGNLSLAILEAKRAFKRLDFNDKDGSYIPVVSDETLAQYLGEAIVAWKTNRRYLRNGIFLIAVTNTFIRFIHFTFGDDYLEYLDTKDELRQKALIRNSNKDVFVKMQ